MFRREDFPYPVSEGHALDDWNSAWSREPLQGLPAANDTFEEDSSIEVMAYLPTMRQSETLRVIERVLDLSGLSGIEMGEVDTENRFTSSE